MTNYKLGLKAGLISGLVWAAIMSMIGVVTVELFYSQTLDFYNAELASNPSFLGGMTAAQYINYLLELNTGITLVLALLFGILIGLLFVVISPKFLGNRSYMLKGVVVAIFFWLLYELIIGTSDIVSLASSLAASLIAGYLLGYLYVRFTRSPREVFPGTSDSISGQDAGRSPFSGDIQP
jgi:lipopolysaccharide export LptBFGC system permease protein LptF